VVVKTQVKVCSGETHRLSCTAEIYEHKAFQVTHIHAIVINSGCATLLNTAHTVGLHCGALTVATILADAAVTPTVSEIT